MTEESSKFSLKNRIKIKLRRKFGKFDYGSAWPEKDDLWYTKIHDANYLLHDNFIEYLKKLTDVKSILEIGCGTGIYPIKNKKLFENVEYTGIDISSTAINYCKNNSDFEFIVGDFISMDFDKKFDLIFSHAVIDHVYDINQFVTKIIDSTKKYAFINAYRGFFPNLAEHKMKWDGHDACYFNDISVSKIRDLLLEKGLTENEFLLRSQKSGQKDFNVSNQLVIEISKK